MMMMIQTVSNAPIELVNV